MRTLATLFAFAFATHLTAADADKPVPTKDAAAKMTVPDGFKVTLFAGEPDIVQPIAFTFDDRGRMWVVECLSYPKWSRDGKGHDRVVILEDTDGDGVHDKKTVFLDNGSNLSGIEIGFGGVWLCSLPNLIFVPVKDDKPAGPPQVVLDGWNMLDTKHNIFNSLTWGPDGWLYGCNGIQAKSWVGAPGTPKEKRTYMDCGVWRYHPTRKVFEAVAHGTTNPFGLDFDEYGELFITNCVIDHLFHFIPGGHYERMYGQDANPHTYGLMKSCVDYRHWGGGAWTDSRANKDGSLKKEHDDAGGGHAHAGAAIYLADNFPAEYRNTLFTANIHGSRLNNDGLARTPSGYKGVRRKDFLFANDPWFRGICVKVGPDGGLYVSDWCDTGECHNYDVADTTNGRIYRTIYKSATQFKGDVSKLTDAELVKMQLHPNDWFVRKARRVLQERAAAGTLEKGTPDALRALLKGEKDTPKRLRVLWALEATNTLDEEDIVAFIRSDDVALRAWGFRTALANADRDVGPQFSVALEKERSAYVLLHVASAICQSRGRGDQYVRTLAGLIHERDDPQLAMMVWYCIADRAVRAPADAHDLLIASSTPLHWRNMVRFLFSGSDEQMNREVAYLVGVLDDVAVLPSQFERGRFVPELLGAMRESLTGRRNVRLPDNWAKVRKERFQGAPDYVRREVESLSVLFGDKDAIAALLKRVSDTSAKADERRAAIELLAPRKLPEFAKTLHALLDDTAMRGPAIRALAGFPDADTPAAILKAYPKLTPEEKLDAVQTLAARTAFAKELLDAIEKGTIPRSDVPVVTARQVLALNDKATTERLEKVWGKVGTASKERAALVKKWKGELTDEALKGANAANGRVLFAKHCAACHKMFGEGQSVGPELTGSQRSNLDYILENVIDPSAVVPREFQMVNFTLSDDRVVGGIVLRETKDAVTVRTTNDTLTIPTADIVTRKQTPLSIMPEGLLDQLKPAEVRDLVAYLRAKEQVPVPK
jgi:putative membrane-bound dehydrogenase-like protein